MGFQDGGKVFMAGCDKMAKCWDLSSNQCIQVYEMFYLSSTTVANSGLF